MQPLTVDENAPLLDYLLRKLAPLNRTRIKQTLKFGSVRVNGTIVTSHAHELKPGDRIDFLGKKEAADERAKKAARFEIVHEDSDVIVVNKPAGLLTIATEKEQRRTLYYELTAYERRKDARNRVFVVHRLDRDTSGLVVFAKNVKAKVTLQADWKKAVKRYTAVAEGALTPKEGRMRSALAEDKFKRVYRSGEKSAKDSVTHYNVLASNGRYSLLELRLETGRKNQIRVHLADKGNPVAGDSKYGAQSDPLGRLALHASYLSFPHPSTGKTLSFDLKAPESFARLAKS